MIKEVKNLGEILSKNMKSNLGTQPVNDEKVRMGFVIATFLDMIGGSSVNEKQNEIDKEEEQVQKSENTKYIENLMKKLQSYEGGKGKPSKKLVQEYKDGKLKVEKGPKMKKVEMKIQEKNEIKESKEREER